MWRLETYRQVQRTQNLSAHPTRLSSLRVSLVSVPVGRDTEAIKALRVHSTKI